MILSWSKGNSLTPSRASKNIIHVADAAYSPNMVQISKRVHIVDGVSMDYTASSPLNVCLLEIDGLLTLVDSGVQGCSEIVGSYVTKLGYGWNQIRQIVLTHLDYDHIGCAQEIREKAGAKVIMHSEDADLAMDKKISKEDLRKHFREYSSEQINRLWEKIQAIKDIPLVVDKEIGEAEDIGASFIMIHTPGHTPGHSVVFSAEDSVLISGDSLSLKGGQVCDNFPAYTVNMELARLSLKRLRNLKFERLISYHNSPLLSGGSNALKSYLDSLE